MTNPISSNMEYCIYLRKSRKDYEAEMRGEGETLAIHEKALLELAKKMNLIIGNIYREVVSRRQYCCKTSNATIITRC